MGTPSHLQSPRTIMAKLLKTRQLPPALPQPPSKITTEQPPALPQSPPPLDLPKTIIEQQPRQPARAPSKMILQPRHRTSPAMWCAAIVCFAFSVLLIVAGAVVLIAFLALKPRPPSFDAANAVLNSVVYAPGPYYFSSDVTLVANVSNPNQRIDLAFRSATVELLFQDRPLAAQALPPFARRRGQSQVLDVRLVSSRVMLPPEVAVEMVDQVRSNRVVYTVRGAFRVEARFGFGHYSYWMYTVCQLELTAPPCGVLVARRCRTKS